MSNLEKIANVNSRGTFFVRERRINMRELTKIESSNIFGGEAISLALVMTYVAVAFVTVAIWKLYTSKKGKFTFPGGFEFEWSGNLMAPFNYFS